MPQDEVLTNFISRTKLPAEEIVDLLTDTVRKREIEQFNQVFGGIESEKLIHYATCLSKAIRPKEKPNQPSKPKKTKKKKAKGSKSDSKSNPS